MKFVRTLTRTPKKTPKETPKKTPKKRVAFGDVVEEIIPNDEAVEPTLIDKILALPFNASVSYAPTILSAASGGDCSLVKVRPLVRCSRSFPHFLRH